MIFHFSICDFGIQFSILRINICNREFDYFRVELLTGARPKRFMWKWTKTFTAQAAR